MDTTATGPAKEGARAPGGAPAMANEAGPKGAVELIVLVREVAAGQESALEALYDCTCSRIYGLALRITQQRELAEEVVSDVYLQAWRGAAGFDPSRGSVLAWLMIQCRTRAIDHIRKRNSRHEQDAVVEDLKDEKTVCPQDLIQGTQRHVVLQKALQTLSARQRQLLSLAFYRGLSHSELAEYTGMPLGTVKTSIRRGLVSLRERLLNVGISTEESL